MSLAKTLLPNRSSGVFFHCCHPPHLMHQVILLHQKKSVPFFFRDKSLVVKSSRPSKIYSKQFNNDVSTKKFITMAGYLFWDGGIITISLPFSLYHQHVVSKLSISNTIMDNLTSILTLQRPNSLNSHPNILSSLHNLTLYNLEFHLEDPTCY